MYPEAIVFPTAPAGSGKQKQRVMAKKVYSVVACIGRKRNIIFQSAPFDTKDGVSHMNAYNEARKAKEQHCMKLWRDGFSYTTDGRYHHIGKNIEGGKIEIFLYSAR